MDKDILFIDYHDDIINQNLERFNKLNINKNKLKKWKNKYPFIYAEDVAYDKYRVNVNKKFICYPLIICMAEKDKDLIKCLKIVRKYKIHFAVRSGGHCVEPFSLSDGIIIDQSKRKEVK